MAFLPEGPNIGFDFLASLRNPAEDVMRKQREQRLMQILQGQQQPQTEEEFSALPEPIRKVLQERFSPQRQQRIQQMREETPDVLAQRAYQQYWGNPQSKLGKVGTTIAQIASGALGAPQPDFGGMAMKQYQLQQQALRDEEGSDSREVMSAINAWAKNQQTDAKTQQADKDRELKSQQMYIQQRLGEEKNAISKLMAAGVYDKAKADAALAQARVKLMEDPVYRAFQLRDPAAAATMLETYGKNDIAQRLKENTDNLIESKKATTATPGSVTVGMTPQLVPTQLSGGATGLKTEMKTSTRVTGGKPATGNPRAFSGGSAAPQVVTPPTAAAQAPAAAAANPFMGQPAAPAPPPRSRADDGIPIGNETYITGPNAGAQRPRLEAREYIPGLVAGSVKQPLSKTKEQAAQDQRLAFSTMFLDATEKAAEDGTLRKNVGLSNNIADIFGRGTSAEFRRMTGKDTDTFNDLSQYYGTLQIANYLKQMSGAQVAEKEYTRLSGAYSRWTDKPETFVRYAYVQSVVPRLLIYLGERGFLEPDKVSKLNLGQFLDENVKRYGYLVDEVSRGGPTAKAAKEKLTKFKDVEGMALDLVQRAFPEAQGGTINTRTPNGEIRVRVPHIVPAFDKAIQDDAKEKARKALRGVVR